MENERAKWSGKTRGGYWGNWCFVQLLKIGIIPAYALLIFVGAYFMLFKRSLCASSADYLSRVFGKKVSIVSIKNYRLILSFGVVLIDKISKFSGSEKIKTDDCCFEIIKNILDEGKGVLILTSHVGGWEMSGAELGKYGVDVGIVGADTEDSNIKKLLSENRKISEMKILADSADKFGAVAAYAALRRGEIVAMHADRAVGSRTARVDFFGASAEVPLSPYALARAAKVRVVQTVCFREKLFRYKMTAFENIDPASTDDVECARTFMKNLENSLRSHPYQWFNFYDFWG